MTQLNSIAEDGVHLEYVALYRWRLSSARGYVDLMRDMTRSAGARWLVQRDTEIVASYAGAAEALAHAYNLLCCCE